eukprot:6171530-Prymnesium_polylepis.3
MYSSTRVDRQEASDTPHALARAGSLPSVSLPRMATPPIIHAVVRAYAGQDWSCEPINIPSGSGFPPPPEDETN